MAIRSVEMYVKRTAEDALRDFEPWEHATTPALKGLELVGR